MIWCFVHAPNSQGWSGELVLALQKKKPGTFALMRVHSIIEEIFFEDDPIIFHYDINVSNMNIDKYLTRKEKGMMQRRSIFGTLEDMHRDEWEKGILKKYPEIYFINNLARMSKNEK